MIKTVKRVFIIWCLCTFAGANAQAKEVDFTKQLNSAFVDLKKNLTALEVDWAENYGATMLAIYRDMNWKLSDAQREAYLLAWLQSYSFIGQYYDEHYSQEDEPRLNVTVPYNKGVASIAGMSPESIIDNKQREAYKQALIDNQLKARNALLQIAIRKAARNWFSGPLRSFLKKQYSSGDVAQCHMILEKIDQHLPSNAIRKRLKNNVRGLWKIDRFFYTDKEIKDCQK